MGQKLGWLDAIVGSLRCSACRAPYRREDLSVVGEREGYVFVRCECRICRREGVAVVLTEFASAPRPRRRPFTGDDVIEAHEILAAYNGNAEGLFATEGQLPR